MNKSAAAGTKEDASVAASQEPATTVVEKPEDGTKKSISSRVTRISSRVTRYGHYDKLQA